MSIEGIAIISVVLFLTNYGFWAGMNICHNWNFGLCLFMAVPMPLLILGVFLL